MDKGLEVDEYSARWSPAWFGLRRHQLSCRGSTLVRVPPAESRPGGSINSHSPALSTRPRSNVLWRISGLRGICRQKEVWCRGRKFRLEVTDKSPRRALSLVSEIRLRRLVNFGPATHVQLSSALGGIRMKKQQQLPRCRPMFRQHLIEQGEH